MRILDFGFKIKLEQQSKKFDNRFRDLGIKELKDSKLKELK